MYRLFLLIAFYPVFHLAKADLATTTTQLAKAEPTKTNLATKANRLISIQTLNIYQPPYSANQSERLSNLLDFIIKDSSDIIFFQEVWIENYYKKIKNASQSIQMESIPFDTSNTKNGLVTLLKSKKYVMSSHQFPYVKGSFYDFIYDLFGISKGFGIAHVGFPNFPDQFFLAINVHLHHLNLEARLIQLLYYFRWFIKQKNFKDPIIFAGDFNFEPDSLEFKMIQKMFLFEEPWTHLKLNYSCTLCEDNKIGIVSILNQFLTKTKKIKKTLDYIFFRSSPNTKIIPKDLKVFPKKYNGNFLSDHYGLKADIQFMKRANNDVLSEEKLRVRIQEFHEVLNKVQSQLSKTYSSEHQFLNTLREDLNNPQSFLFHYLKY